MAISAASASGVDGSGICVQLFLDALEAGVGGGGVPRMGVRLGWGNVRFDDDGDRAHG